LALVVLVSFGFEVAYELGPFDSDLLVDFSKKLYSLVLVHFLVDVTVVLIVFGRLEALGMLAGDNSALLWLVLTEVEAFSWEHVFAN